MNPDASFLIVLTRNSSNQQFTRSTPCAFSNHIPTLSNFKRRWKVCLWSLCATSKVVQDNVLKYLPNSMLVYTDMVTVTVIEDVAALLLAVLPLPANNSPAKVTPVQLAYHRVKVQHLMDIQ